MFTEFYHLCIKLTLYYLTDFHPFIPEQTIRKRYHGFGDMFLEKNLNNLDVHNTIVITLIELELLNPILHGTWL